jgi:hypothetical protein
MGMFDNINCEMPLPEGAGGVLEWQTKDLDCSMTHYAIRNDGRLVDAQIRMEPKPGAPAAPEFMSKEYCDYRREWWDLKEGPDVPVNFTGAVTFYGSDKSDQWWEFCAFIEDGTCFKIVQIKPVQ